MTPGLPEKGSSLEVGRLDGEQLFGLIIYTFEINVISLPCLDTVPL